MKAAALTYRGVENIVMLDIKEIIHLKGEKLDSCVVFDASEKDIWEFAYRSQSVTRILKLLGLAEVNNQLEETVCEIKKSIGEIAFLKGKTFRVNCRRSGSQDYSSQDVAAIIGEYIVSKTGGIVKLIDPEYSIHLDIDGTRALIGVDLAGDLGKRDYRVFTHPTSLNGITAYALLRFAGYKGDQVLLDPFAGSGIIPIEAALMSTGTSPHQFKAEKFKVRPIKARQPKAAIMGFDILLRNVIASKKNASIAGIEKHVSLSKVELEWLDTKMDSSSVDMIVTHPPSPSKANDKKALEKLYMELLYQADYVLKKKGSMALIFQNKSLFIEVLKKSDKFSLKDETSFWQGNQEMHAILAVRK